MNGAQAFFKTIVDGGIDTVFGCPGMSEMQTIEELGHTDRYGDLREAGLTALFLASNASDFMTGEMLYLDGGMSRSHGALA